VAETAFAAVRLVELVDHVEHDVLDALDHELSDALTAADFGVDRRVGVDQEHLELAAIAAVDEARCVQTGETSSQRQATARLDESGVADRDGHRHAARHEHPAARRRDDHRLAGHQVETRVTWSGIGGQGKIGVESDYRDRQHGARIEHRPRRGSAWAVGVAQASPGRCERSSSIGAMSFEPEAGSRGLRDHVGVLRRRAVIIVAITALAVVAALLWSLSQPRRYTANAQVLVQQEPATVADPRPDQIVESRRLDPLRVMQNEARLASSQIVRDRAQTDSGMATSVSVSNPRDTDVLIISATASSAEAAAAEANAAAAAYVAVRQELSDSRATASIEAIDGELAIIDARVAAIDGALADPATSPEQAIALAAEREALVEQRAAWVRQQAVLSADAALAATNQATIINQANPPSSPSQPATLRNLALAFVLGLAIALAVAYGVDQLDDSVRTPDDLERSLTLPLLGEVDTLDLRGGVRAVPATDPDLVDAGLKALAPDGTSVPEGAHVLAVPQGTRARVVRRNASLLDRLGVHLVGTVLLSDHRTGP
jgi:capsular polysaccharide biosynthesis protein